MRIVVSVLLVFSLLLNSGCAIIEKETTNRGGYLDAVLDDHWLKADSKGMRALRAFALQVSLARIASVSAKNESDRQLLAIRIGALTTRFIPIYLCAFNSNPLGVEGAKKDPCFYYDSAMVDYSTGLFDLAKVALPDEDVKKLVTMVAGAAINPLNVIELLTTLMQIGKDAIKYGRIVGALYRDTVELEVQTWLGTPPIDVRPSFRVTDDDIRPLWEAYNRGNDDMRTWLTIIAELRGRGLEPIAQPKFFGELAGLMNYLCDLITKEEKSADACKANLPKTVPTPPVVLGDPSNFKIGDSSVASLSIGRKKTSGSAGGAGKQEAGKEEKKKVKVLKEEGQTVFGNFEISMTPSDVKAYETSACMAPTGAKDLGPLGSPSRVAIQAVIATVEPELNEKPEMTSKKAIILGKRLKKGTLRPGMACPKPAEAPAASPAGAQASPPAAPSAPAASPAPASPSPTPTPTPTPTGAKK